ncbi:hypothetical protein P168DRAFT_287014 [Aspergillus campestris IBT 28561]|uniref:Uncharacterized protein n=1 Tax=Aspergillus campestris (strain IBT 28561) TaxID=1392248 RepID=A0A2I1DGE7_ASPC2|nr:uncharacterized protein P168DRAFT_287014 [Aspergillus campestris IBT 28561]PKY08944.1 hypothetical protein P168DRAFT_287014 [Aspergillus campestris IBT 28561]
MFQISDNLETTSVWFSAWMFPILFMAVSLLLLSYTTCYYMLLWTTTVRLGITTYPSQQTTDDLGPTNHPGI